MLEPMLERGRKPGDLILFQTVLLPGLGVARMAHPGTILFLAKQGGQSGGLESALFSMGIRVSSLRRRQAPPRKHTRSGEAFRFRAWAGLNAPWRAGVKLGPCVSRDSRACCSGRMSEAWFARGERLPSESAYIGWICHRRRQREGGSQRPHEVFRAF